MPVHVVRQGDCLSSIAHSYGFSSWQALYNHPDNAELKQRRPNPHTLFPGDQVVVPEREPKEVGCATGAEHRFRAKVPKAKLHLVLRAPGGEVLADKKYELTVGAQTFRGRTGGGGELKHDLHTSDQDGVLLVFAAGDGAGPLRLPVRIGHLDPIEELSGVQARLTNLGFACLGETEIGRRTRRALRGFQRRRGLEATGELDDATRAELKSAHDG
jgi:hypothetical protein